MSNTSDRYCDDTSCRDEFGDKSTVGFELLWREVLMPQLLSYRYSLDGHDVDPRTRRCLECGRTAREILLDRIRCEGVSEEE
jgi:hypothetical protein